MQKFLRSDVMIQLHVTVNVGSDFVDNWQDKSTKNDGLSLISAPTVAILVKRLLEREIPNW